MRRTNAMIRASLAVGLLCLTACVGHYRKLTPVARIPMLATLEQAGEALEGRLVLITVDGDEGSPVRLALEEVGPSNSGQAVVLVHGVLSDRTTWRFLRGDLGRDHRLLLVDMVGCGESDRPDPRGMGPEGYGPSAQARRLLGALRTVSRLDGAPQRLTLVGHSLGGTVLLRMLGDRAMRSEFHDVIARIDSVVLISPLDVAIEKVHPTFEAIASLGRVKVTAARVMGLLGREAARASLGSFDDPAGVPREEARRLATVLRRKELRRPARAMIRQAAPFDPETRRPDWDRVEALEADYAAVEIPTLIVWGERDETLPVSMGYKLQAQLPDARLRILDHTKHSPQLERPRLTASLIRDFIRDTGEGWAAIEEIEPLRLQAYGSARSRDSRRRR